MNKRCLILLSLLVSLVATEQMVVAVESRNRLIAKAESAFKTFKEDMSCLFSRKKKCTNKQKARIAAEAIGLVVTVAVLTTTGLAIRKGVINRRIRKHQQVSEFEKQQLLDDYPAIKELGIDPDNIISLQIFNTYNSPLYNKFGADFKLWGDGKGFEFTFFYDNSKAFIVTVKNLEDIPESISKASYKESSLSEIKYKRNEKREWEGKAEEPSYYKDLRKSNPARYKTLRIMNISESF